MEVWHIALIVAACGALGAFVKQALTEKVPLPYTEQRVWYPGIVGNILAGAVAAFATWALYGPISNLDFAQKTPATFPIFQAASALISGFGAAQILKVLSDQKADRLSRDQLADILKKNIESK